VTKLLASTGGFVGTYSVGGYNGGKPMAAGVVFDGTYIWVVNTYPSTVTKLRASKAANLGTFPLGAQSNAPIGAAFDGAHISVVYGP